MKVNSTDFQNKIGMYFTLAETEEIIITRAGKPPLKVTLAQNETPLTDEIVKLAMENKKKKKNQPILDSKDIRAERLSRYE